MDYTMTKFIKKYFERYCDQYLPGETKELTEKAEVIFDKLMHETPDMGGKENMMASNMDITVAFFAYYEASDHRIGGEAMEILIDWLADDYKWAGFFLDMNRWPFVKPLYYKVYSNHAKAVEEHKAKGEWTGTWSLKINPDQRDTGINYHMIGCPLYQFVKDHGYEDMMPYVCKFDYIFERFLHAKLIRTRTEATGGDCCDYWFVPDKSPIAKEFIAGKMQPNETDKPQEKDSKEPINKNSAQSLKGKTAIVTGANSGMGMATVEALSDKGARVIMLCRNADRGQKAFDQLTQEKDRDIKLMLCDLGNFDSIRNFVKEFREENERLDILINNAGFISLDRQETDNGLERQIGINYFGHFLLTMLLQKMMKAGSRIVVVASGAHKAGKIHFDDINLTRGYNVVSAYGQSKLAEVLFTRYLSRKLEKRGITVNCCHPGAVATNMGVDRETGFGKTITGMLKPFFLTPAQGCETAVFLATDESVADVTGEYFYKCKIAKSSRRSKDMVAAKRLFRMSCEITGLK